jgi:hypothetical protein
MRLRLFSYDGSLLHEVPIHDPLSGHVIDREAFRTDIVRFLKDGPTEIEFELLYREACAWPANTRSEISGSWLMTKVRPGRVQIQTKARYIDAPLHVQFGLKLAAEAVAASTVLQQLRDEDELLFDAQLSEDALFVRLSWSQKHAFRFAYDRVTALP